MDSSESALINALSTSPENWQIRLMAAEEKYNLGAYEEAGLLIQNSPVPPPTADILERAANIGGAHTINQAEAFAAINPSEPYGHQLLAHLYQLIGDEQKSQMHSHTAATIAAATAGVVQETYQQQPEALQAHDPVVVAQPEVVYTEEKEGPSVGKRNKKGGAISTAVFATVLVHVGILALAILLVVFKAPKPEREIVAAAPRATSKKADLKKKQVIKQVKNQPSAAASAPIANMMRANAVAKFALPEITKTTTAPLGLGDGNLGFGGFGGFGGSGSGTSGLGNGASLFGGSGGGALTGYLYDLKTDKSGRAINKVHKNYLETFNGLIPDMEKLIRREFSEDSLDKFARAKNPLSFNTLCIPTMPADIGPKSFGSPEIKPSAWIVVYRGTVSPAEGETEIRFVGDFDDILYVFHNDKMVLDGCVNNFGSFQGYSRWRPSDTISYQSSWTIRDLRVGRWVKIRKGDSITVVCGEVPGGLMRGLLLCQERGVKYTKGKYVPFVIGELTQDEQKRLSSIPDITFEDVPRFN